MSKPVIQINGVAKRFGRKQVLESVDLKVEPGEIFAFLGRNGAGKTTTIRMLLGLLRPDSGTLHVLGQDPCLPASRARNAPIRGSCTARLFSSDSYSST